MLCYVKVNECSNEKNDKQLTLVHVNVTQPANSSSSSSSSGGGGGSSSYCYYNINKLFKLFRAAVKHNKIFSF